MKVRLCSLVCAFTVAVMGLPLAVSGSPAAADTGPVLTFPSGTTSLCDFLKAAPANSTVQIADGTYDLDSDPSTPSSQICVVHPQAQRVQTGTGTQWTWYCPTWYSCAWYPVQVPVYQTIPAAHHVAVTAANPAVGGDPMNGHVVISGSLRCDACDGWRFSYIKAEGNAPIPQSFPDVYPAVVMMGGDGWSWSHCAMTNPVGFGGDPMRRAASYDLLGITGQDGQQAVNWNVSDCTLRGNGVRSDDPNANRYHIVYINPLYASDYVAHGNSTHVVMHGVLERNDIGDTQGGFPVKVGFGFDGTNIGWADGVTLRSNHISDSNSVDGDCGIFVAETSTQIILDDNTISCPDHPIYPRDQYGIRVDTGNYAPTDATITRNHVTGTPGASPGACFEEGPVGPILLTYRQWVWFGLAAAPQQFFRTRLDDCSSDGYALGPGVKIGSDPGAGDANFDS